MTYRPESYAEMVQDATNAVTVAIQDGIQLMEVEFPAVPVSIDGEGLVASFVTTQHTCLGSSGMADCAT
jgi:hypothetical protein